MRVEQYIIQLAEKYGLTILRTRGKFFPYDALPTKTAVQFDGTIRHGGGTSNWPHTITDDFCHAVNQPITYETIRGNCEEDGEEIAVEGLDVESFLNSSPGRKALLGLRLSVYGKREPGFSRDSPIVRYLLDKMPELENDRRVRPNSKEEVYLVSPQLRRVALHSDAFSTPHYTRFYEFFLPHISLLGKQEEKKVKVEKTFPSNGRIISEE